jgi:hypothetical protein
VVYASSSSALATGSDLTFSGGNLSTTGQILLNNNNYVGFKNTSGSPSVSIFNDTSNFLNLYNSGNTGTIFYVNAAEQMRLTTTGLGIGTSSPADSLHVNSPNGSTYIRVTNATGDRTYIGAEGGLSVIYAQTSAGANAPLAFLTGSTERARITAAGEFLIGTTSAFAKLSVIVPNGADRNLIQAGVTSATDGLTVKWNNSTSTIRVNIQNLPTSATGLASGDLYVSSGFLKVA